MLLIKYKLSTFIISILIILSSFSLVNSEINTRKTVVSYENMNTNIWQKIFGGDFSDIGFRTIENRNYEYITVGWTESYGYGDDDVWLIKTDYEGNMLWNKTFGGKSSDRGFSVKQTIDDGYIITGYTSSYGNGILDLWLIKTDKYGNEEWNCTYGGSDSDFGLDIIDLNGEGFVITGYTSSFGPDNSNIWLIKTDNIGNLIWDKVFGGKYCESGFSVIEDNGYYILCGYIESFGFGEYDGFIIKTNHDGSFIWNYTYGGKHVDVIRSIVKNLNGGYIAVGWSESNKPYNEDIWVINLDDKGNILWNKTFDYGLNDEGFSICNTLDDGYLIVGSTQKIFNGDTDLILLKINNNGDKVWVKSFGGFLNDVAYNMINTSDDGFIISGYQTSYDSGKEDVWLIKTNQYGNINRIYINLNRILLNDIIYKLFYKIFK